MHKYGANSIGAVLRVLVMAKALDRSLSKDEAKLLAQVSAAKGVTPEQLLGVVEQYAADMAEARQTEKEAFLGNPALPRRLVETALDEIQGGATRLQVAQLLYTLLNRGQPSREGVLFVEAAVARWGIAVAWRKWLGVPPAAAAARPVRRPPTGPQGKPKR